jgi:hypothetical protein
MTEQRREGGGGRGRQRVLRFMRTTSVMAGAREMAPEARAILEPPEIGSVSTQLLGIFPS